MNWTVLIPEPFTCSPQLNCLEAKSPQEGGSTLSTARELRISANLGIPVTGLAHEQIPGGQLGVKETRIEKKLRIL